MPSGVAFRLATLVLRWIVSNSARSFFSSGATRSRSASGSSPSVPSTTVTFDPIAA